LLKWWTYTGSDGDDMISGIGSSIALGGCLARVGAVETGTGNNTTMIIVADGQMLAIKFTPETNQHVTHVDMVLNYAGDLTAGEFTLEIDADTADTPDTATIMGAPTAHFHGLSTAAGWAGGGTDPIELGTHADLVANTPYWLVLKRSGGTNLSASLTVGLRGTGLTVYPMRARIHNGTSWTAVSASIARFGYIIKVGTLYYGLPFNAVATATSYTDIFDTNKQGIRFKTACRMFLRGVTLTVTKTGTPEPLIVTVYSNTTELGHVDVPIASIITNIPMFVYFPTPIELTPDVMNYIILSQAGTSTSHDYELRQMTVPANYIGTVHDDNFRMVYGTSADPTALTVSEIECPGLFPMVTDMVTDLDSPTIDPHIVIEGNTINGTAGTYHEATVSEVQDGVMFGADSALEGTYVGGGGAVVGPFEVGPFR
jgi:hypothetical protein